MLAASALCRDLLAGPRTCLVTAHRSRDAWLLTAHGERWLVTLRTPRAVAHPQSLVVQALPAGSPQVSIGDGCLWYGDQRVTVSRWFTPPRVVRGSLRAHAARPDPTPELLTGWRHRLGAGEGLTPYGDDVICGLMLGLLATDHEHTDRLAREIRETDLEARTTAASAALLRCTADGWCIPEVAAVVTAVGTGSGLDEAVRQLLAVGHTSGHGLLAGLSSVLDQREGGLVA